MERRLGERLPPASRGWHCPWLCDALAPHLVWRAASRKIHERYFWAIGRPTRTIPCGSLDPAGGVWQPSWSCNCTGYRVHGHASYMRPFTGGVVVVNAGNTTDEAVPLGGSFVDPERPAGGKVAAVAMAAHTGRVLLNAAP